MRCLNLQKIFTRKVIFILKKTNNVNQSKQFTKSNVNTDIGLLGSTTDNRNRQTADTTNY